MLKNVVFQILMEIRRIKAKPKLGELLQMFKGMTDKKEKEKFIEKIKEIYNAKQ